MNAPLLVTRDTELLDEVLRLAAAAGTTVDVAHEPASALQTWSRSPLVLVGPDLAGPVAAEQPARRSEVFLLRRGHADASDYRCAVGLGATQVLELPAAEAWLADALADAGDGGRRPSVTIGFLGGSGGVGASSLACATAQVAASEVDSALIDLDPLGAGVEGIVGLESQGGIRWPDLAGSQGRLGSRALRDSLPSMGRLAVLGWGPALDPVDEAVVREALAAVQRGHDVVVLDLPRRLDERAACAAARCDHLVLVASCSLPGAAAAVRTLAGVTGLAPEVHLAARTSGGVQPGQLASVLGVPLLVEVGHQRRLAEHVDLGLGPIQARRGTLARAAGRIVAQLATPAVAAS
jgi:secretion/DNA translocation related CpaE-like protein